MTPRLSRVVDGRAELIADLPGTSPDGVAVCADGGYLIAVYYPFQLLYVPPEGGRFEVVLDDPTGIHIPMPTNAVFYGDELDHLAIGSLGGTVIRGIRLGIRGGRCTTHHSHHPQDAPEAATLTSSPPPDTADRNAHLDLAQGAR